LSYSTIQGILQEKMNDYHYIRVQNLQEEDYPRRKRFCENFLRKIDEDLEFHSRVIFSDESCSHERIVNSHNMHMWRDKNPRVTRLRNFQIR